MRYFLPALMVFALAVPATGYASGGRECGPHLQQQMEQAKKSAEYAIELEKGQRDQAQKSAAYAIELEKIQKDQAEKSAVYAVELSKGQADQAAKSAAYAIELAKGQADQAAKSAAYARELDAQQRKILQYYADLCTDQTAKYNLGTPVPRVREAAVEKPLRPLEGGVSPMPLPATADLPTSPDSPITVNNGLSDPKKDLNKALNEIDKQQ